MPDTIFEGAPKDYVKFADILLATRIWLHLRKSKEEKDAAAELCREILLSLKSPIDLPFRQKDRREVNDEFEKLRTFMISDSQEPEESTGLGDLVNRLFKSLGRRSDDLRKVVMKDVNELPSPPAVELFKCNGVVRIWKDYPGFSLSARALVALLISDGWKKDSPQVVEAGPKAKGPLMIDVHFSVDTIKSLLVPEKKQGGQGAASGGSVAGIKGPGFVMRYLEACSTVGQQGEQGEKRLPVPLVVSLSEPTWREPPMELPDEFLVYAPRFNAEHFVRQIDDMVMLWNNSDYGFPTACVRDFFLQIIRNALGFTGNLHQQVASDSFRRIKEELEKMGQTLSSRVEGGNAPDSHRQAIDDLVYILKESTAEILRDGVWRIFSEILEPFRDALDEFTDSVNRLFEMIANGDQDEIRGQHRSLVYSLGWLEECIPVPSGAAYLSYHLNKTAILVIDDDAENEVENLKNTPVYPYMAVSVKDQLKLGDIFEFTALNAPKKKGSVTEWIESFFYPKPPVKEDEADVGSTDASETSPPADASPFRFLAVMLDISFEEWGYKQGVAEDAVKAIKKAAPYVHVLISTNFGQERYIFRAISEGADWYCRKDQRHRLLRNLNALEMNRMAPKVTGYKKLKFGGEPLPDNLQVFPHQSTKELVAVLLDDLPGDRIYVQKLHGGLSAASTFKVYRRCLEAGPGDLRHGKTGELMPLEEGPAPIIVKVGRTAPLLSEQERYKHLIRPYIDNNVGRIDRPMAKGRWGRSAIAYSYAGETQGVSLFHSENGPKTLAELFESNLSQPDQRLVQPFEDYQAILDNLFCEILPRIHRIQEEFHREVYTDSPNPFFDEHDLTLDNYQIRLPTTLEINATSISEVWPDEQTIHDSYRTMKEFVELWPRCPILEKNKLCEGKGFVVRGLSENSLYLVPIQTHWRKVTERDEPLIQIRLTGSHIEHVVRHRSIRHGQVVSFEGTLTSTRGDFWENKLKLGQSLKVVRENTDRCPMSETSVKDAMDVLSQYDHLGRRRGVIHGDLNLSNIIVECQPMGRSDDVLRLRPTSNMPWLIDFARTRRDSIAFDFAEFESVLASTLLRREWFAPPGRRIGDGWVSSAMEFLRSVNMPPWTIPAAVREDRRLTFVFEAIYYMRRIVAKQRIPEKEYLAHLYLSNLVTLKVFGPGKEGAATDRADFAYLGARIALEQLDVSLRGKP